MANPISWSDPDSLGHAYRAAFDKAAPFTVGIEEELILVDAETHEPVPEVERVLSAVEGDVRFAPELRACQIEIVTPVCHRPRDVAYELARARTDLGDAIGSGTRLLALGVHPRSTAPVDVTVRPRYVELASRCGSVALRGAACGLHVHVAVGDADAALPVFNALRSFLPEIAALAANSPFSEGADSGFATFRSKLNEALPLSGLPPAIPSWDWLADFVSWGRKAEVLQDPSNLWWDMRPHPVHGTIEIRVGDTQTSVEQAAGVTAFCQALVVDLILRHRAGEQLPVHDDVRIRANLWQAQRHGLDATLTDLATGQPRQARSQISLLLMHLYESAAALRFEDDLDTAWSLVAEGGGERQRRIAARAGIDGLTAELVEETHESATRAILGGSVV